MRRHKYEFLDAFLGKNIGRGNQGRQDRYGKGEGDITAKTLKTCKAKGNKSAGAHSPVSTKHGNSRKNYREAI